MSKGRLIFVLGGARSGKSSFAQKLAKRFDKRVVFIATATACDEEMRQRIKLHKRMRPRQWKTIEKTKDLAVEIKKIKNSTIIVECLSLLVSNLLFESKKERGMLKQINELIAAIEKSSNNVIVVSNEVGQGIVLENKQARTYRDILGKANQLMARKANEFYILFAGIPIEIKKLKEGIS